MLRIGQHGSCSGFSGSLLKIFDQEADTNDRLQALDSPDSTGQTSSSNSDAYSKIYLNKVGAARRRCDARSQSLMRVALSVSEKEKAKGAESPYFKAMGAAGVRP